MCRGRTAVSSFSVDYFNASVRGIVVTTVLNNELGSGQCTSGAYLRDRVVTLLGAGGCVSGVDILAGQLLRSLQRRRPRANRICREFGIRGSVPPLER